MIIAKQNPKSVLFITLDSCRFDIFQASQVPNLKALGTLFQAMAPGNFTYASHQAMFVGFTPSVAHKFEPFVNSKFAKIFRMLHGGFEGKGSEHFRLSGKNIIDGLKRQGYLTIGSGAVGWFNPETETAQALIQDFEHFYFPGDTYSLHKQLDWIYPHLQNSEQKIFAFLNIGETHVPYYYPGANWSKDYNPCVPFSDTNDAAECRKRQQACLEYVDSLLEPLLKAFVDSTIVICADHGDCWGEDGLWEHGFYHPKVLEVPLIFKLGEPQYFSDKDFSEQVEEKGERSGEQGFEVNSEPTLEQCQEQLRNLQEELDWTQSQLQRSRQEAIAMKSSKFWKLRKVWFKFKRLLPF